MIFNLDRIFEYFGNSPERYQLAATLEGHSGPINSLKFNSSGTMIASGGKNSIICLRKHTHNSQGMTKLLGSGMSLRGVRFRFWPILVVDGARSLALTSSLMIALLWVLCFGTGQGQFVIYRQIRKIVSTFLLCTLR